MRPLTTLEISEVCGGGTPEMDQFWNEMNVGSSVATMVVMGSPGAGLQVNGAFNEVKYLRSQGYAVGMIDVLDGDVEIPTFLEGRHYLKT
ncbi:MULTISPECIES: hypothetical protein [Asaia]|uniref:hypothetical protein n=1 Tax=Asaia TaxID=91914 RepID=UPI002554A7EE|nr:hypothetical protein [Asaia sp. HumB]MDL2172498.1 hypothetical protein [Asaia sp. HumB]